MSWRLAGSLVQLRKQIDTIAPKRSKVSDGTLGDASHSSRSSDHNPNDEGIVCALDITNDPQGGVSSEKLAEAIRTSKDPRLKYVISNRKIANPSVAGGAWRVYNGSNPHDHHCHISVKDAPNLVDSTKPWNLAGFTGSGAAPSWPSKPPEASKPIPKPNSVPKSTTVRGGVLTWLIGQAINFKELLPNINNPWAFATFAVVAVLLTLGAYMVIRGYLNISGVTKQLHEILGDGKQKNG